MVKWQELKRRQEEADKRELAKTACFSSTNTHQKRSEDPSDQTGDWTL
jgi:hypothetical protein